MVSNFLFHLDNDNMTGDYRSSDRDVQRDRLLSSIGDLGQVESVEFGQWTGIIAKFRAAIRSLVPLGYEDEAGFHVGVMSSEE
jgi:hypothetical protein